MANGVFATEARGLVLVDTSVWIDFLQRPRSNIHPFFPTRKSTYFLAAEIFRRLRETGLQVQTVDATIAAIAVENRVPLFTLNLRHFIPMCKVSRLRLHPVPAGKLTLKQALFISLLFFIFYFFSYPEVDPDLWGHLYFGREILRS